MTQQEQQQTNAVLAGLFNERSKYFEQRTGVPFDQGLELIRQWDDSPDPELAARAEVLRLRYVDGLSYDDIAREMQIEKKSVENLLERAKYHLASFEK